MPYPDIADLIGRMRGDYNVAILHRDDGAACTRIDGCAYPVGSDGTISVRYEHPQGILLSIADALRLGIEIED